MWEQSQDGGSGTRERAGPDSRLSLLRELGEQAVLESIFRKGPITHSGRRKLLFLLTSVSRISDG